MKADEKFYIGTTRFTNDTYKENKEWREKHNWKGCIYGLNKRTPRSLPKNALIYVLEMNNEKNEIEGIGLIRNYIDYRYKAYIYKGDPNYNRFIYNSKYRVDRSNIKYKKVLEILEKLVFYGAGHYKRGQGITTINWDKLDTNMKKLLILFFKKLFKLN
tara:strand:+ start:709 stop:1185 length:477 start_codon:yes stop_codon:yes gene_type:complete